MATPSPTGTLEAICLWRHGHRPEEPLRVAIQVQASQGAMVRQGAAGGGDGHGSEGWLLFRSSRETV